MLKKNQMINKIKFGLIILALINVFLLISGITIPYIISSNQFPLSAIIFLVTSIAIFFVSIILCILNKIYKEKYNET